MTNQAQFSSSTWFPNITQMLSIWKVEEAQRSSMFWKLMQGHERPLLYT